jgi:peptide-methionine (S)-S-oxide reductase
VTRAIILAARRAGVPSLQEQLDYALRLVSWSWIARQCEVQIELIDVLLDAGASPRGNPNNALVNGNFAATEHLLARGAELTLAAALCLGRWDDAAQLARLESDAEKQFAFVLAALNGKVDALRWMIHAGIDVNRPSEGLYPHGTPLHHAVCSGSLEAVKVLVEAGAKLGTKDTAWNGTPLGWAQYYLGEAKGDHAGKQYTEIAAYLGANEAQR